MNIGIGIDKEFLRKFRDSLILYVVVTVIIFAIGLLFGMLPEKAYPYMIKYTNLGDEINGNLYISILLNNIYVSFLLLLTMIFFGHKHLSFLPKFYPIYIGALTGIAIFIAAAKTNILYSIMLILPHGLVEVPLIFFVLNSGYFFRKKEDDIRKKIIIFAKLSIGIVAVLMIAAYIEVYITRDLASLFL